MTFDKGYAKYIYELWRNVGRSPQLIFDTARELISLADAEMIEELEVLKVNFTITKIKHGREIAEPEPSGVIEDEWGITS
jgi:hypothetical protein